MPILTADNLSKSFGTRLLFRDASFSVEAGEKLGFIGPNGSGKSTLFQILAGLEEADGGRVAIGRDISVGHLAQEPEFEAGQTIWDAVVAGNPERLAAFREFTRISEQLRDSSGDGSDGSAALLARQDRLSAEIERLGGWGWQHEAEILLTRLGLDQWDRQVERLSGGEKKRVALGRVLFDRPELLLLDEPTNHLDADTTLWLEDQLLDYPGGVLLITHDRYFLDRVVDRMIEVHPDHFLSFQGGYTEYLEARAERTERLRVETEKRDRLIDQELAWLKRSPAARTGKQKARIKRARAAESEKRFREPEQAAIRFGDPPRLGRTVVDLESVSRSFGDKAVVRDFSAQIQGGERIGVIGPNGAGKTTLLRLLTGEIEPDSGRIVRGSNTRIAYFDQKRMDLDPGSSVYESISDSDWVVAGGQKIHVRSYLERFLFPTAMHDQRVGSLSGGERNRLLLARLLLNEANLLLLDEPTNDLDLETLRTLESALVDFGGTAVVVTHDRYFLDKVATALFVFEGDGRVHRHEGGYDLYRRLREERERNAPPPPKPDRRAPKARAEGTRPRKLSYREQREFDGMEEAILEAEERKERLGERLSDPALYVETPEEVAPLTAALEETEAEITRLYQRWEELEAIASGDN